jgi:hypothetical protein
MNRVFALRMAVFCACFARDVQLLFPEFLGESVREVFEKFEKVFGVE